MPNRRFNTQVAQPRKALAKGGKALKAVDKEKNPGLAKLPTKVRNKMGFMKKGGRMYKDGGKVRRMSQGYKDRKDESIAMRIRKPRTARQLKDSRDESYGKFGSKAKKSGKINR